MESERWWKGPPWAWSAIIRHNLRGGIGSVGIASASETEDQAVADAKAWIEDHPVRETDRYLSPSCEIEVWHKDRPSQRRRVA